MIEVDVEEGQLNVEYAQFKKFDDDGRNVTLWMSKNEKVTKEKFLELFQDPDKEPKRGLSIEERKYASAHLTLAEVKSLLIARYANQSIDQDLSLIHI